MMRFGKDAMGGKMKCVKMILVAAALAGAEPGERGGPGHDGPRYEGMGPGPGGMDFLHPKMLKELGLSEDQQKKIKDQKLAFQKRKIQLQSEKSILELDLQNVFSTAPVKEAEALKVAEKIAEVDKKLLLMRVEGMGRFLAGLTPEQHRKVMEHQAEMREKRKAWREEMRKGWRDDDLPGGREGKGGR